MDKEPKTAVEGVFATLARIHPDKCGTHSGYLQISRARTALRRLGIPEHELPTYDRRCKRAWARNMLARRDRGGKLDLPKGPRKDAEPVPPLSEDAECGTEMGVLRHRREGTELCAKCKPEALRTRVKKKIALARSRRPED